MSPPVIEVKGVEFDYGEGPVLRGVDLTIAHGAMVCLVGPSGSGKTTLLNVMGLLEKPKAGSLIFCGHEVAELSESRLEQLRLRDLGFVFQSFFLIPTLSVLENTTYFLPALGLNAKAANERGEEVLKQVGLIEFKNKLPRELSGGQRQRVAIARALAKKPRVILADEPTANLDQETADTIVEVFQELRRSQNVSFVFSTHDSHLVSYAQEVHLLNRGKLA